MQAEKRKHQSNDAECGELHVGWVCILLVVESFGCWGPEAQCSLSGRLATRVGQPKSITTKPDLW